MKTTEQLRYDLANGIYEDGLRIYGKMPVRFKDMEVDKAFDDPSDLSQTCILDVDGNVIRRKLYSEYLIILGYNEEFVIARLCVKDDKGNLVIPGGLKSPELESLCQIVPLNCIFSHNDALIEAQKLRGDDELNYSSEVCG